MMQILLYILVFLFVLVSGGLTWFYFHPHHLRAKGEKMLEIKRKEKLSFQWYYVIVPVAIFFFSLFIICFFYHQLPAGEIATRFALNGEPNKWSSGGGVLAQMMAVQLGLVAAAVAIAYGLTRMSIISDLPSNSLLTAGKLLSFMGNLFGLPQIIISFAMLDILWYAIYHIHLMPMWLFVLIVLVLAAFVPLLLGILAFVKRKRVPKPEGE
jgi:uncharacterized membrane protein